MATDSNVNVTNELIGKEIHALDDQRVRDYLMTLIEVKIRLTGKYIWRFSVMFAYQPICRWHDRECYTAVWYIHGNKAQTHVEHFDAQMIQEAMRDGEDTTRAETDSATPGDSSTPEALSARTEGREPAAWDRAAATVRSSGNDVGHHARAGTVLDRASSSDRSDRVDCDDDR